VWFLGDLTLGGPREAITYLGALNGHINIVPGGHDYRWITHLSGVQNVAIAEPLVSLELKELSPDGVHAQVIVLCHYALRVWDRSHFNSWGLYGHSHGTLPGIGKSFDVGVDCFDFAPVSLEEVVEIMKTRPDNVDLVEEKHDR
jgi:calcineurin-like phosphoesterase family protein